MDVVVKLSKLITTPEAAKYLDSKYLADKKNTPHLSTEQVDKLKLFVSAILARENRQQIDSWKGELSETFDTFRAKDVSIEVEEVVQQIPDLKSVNMDYALMGKASTELVRHYSKEDSQVLTVEEDEAMDKLLMAWLNRNLITQIGDSLYYMTEEGKSALDSRGNLIKADPEKLQRLLHDKENGFQNFLLLWDIKIKLHEYEHQEPIEKETLSASAEESSISSSPARKHPL